MKKLLLSFVSILFGFCMLFTSSCKMVIDVEKIELLAFPESATYNIGEFNYSDYLILVTYTDGSVKEITLAPEMFSDYDRKQLNDEGIHTLTVNYEGKKLTIDVNIVLNQFENDDEEQIIKPYLEDAVYTYDGKEHTIDVQGDIPANATIYYPNGNSFTKAGTYNITCKVVADGYQTVSLAAKMVIKKAEYDLSGLQLVVDYGLDDDDNPKTSFEYDGKEHSVFLSGNIPEGLSNPTYYIGLVDEPFSTYVKGKGATNAGNYMVYATFTGDSTNYETENLYVTTTLTIDKKAITQEGLENLKFEDKTVYYDGKEHRLTIDNIVLPEGVSVEYVDENGKIFKAKKEANEEGYLVIARFILDNQNYQIVQNLSARLYIKKLDYSGLLDISIDDTHQISYDGNEHSISITGTDNNVWATKITINDEEYDLNNIPTLTEAGDYEITVEFDNNPNYNSVDPLTKTLSIDPIDFGNLIINFGDEEFVYDGEKHSQSYEVVGVPIGASVEVSYFKTGEEEIYEGAPTDIVDVGSYITSCRLIYNKNNYINAPETYEDIVTEFTIKKRYYDAKNIISLDNIRTPFAAGVNQINLCTFDEILPDWILNYRVLVFNEQGISTTKVIDAGLYQYQFEYFYYDGTKEAGELVITSEKCNLAELKVIGKQIRAADYELSYTSVDTYDINTSHIPSIDIKLDNSVNPRYTIEYYYEGYSNNHEKELVEEENYLETSKLAGNHYFTINIMAYNYETLTVEVEILVNRKEITINKYNFGVEDYVGSYDGNDHSDQFIIYDDTDLEYANYETVLEVNTTESANPGIDVGSYKYAIKFTPKDINYVVNQEYYSLYKYTVTINKVNLEALEALNPYSYFRITTIDGDSPSSSRIYPNRVLKKENSLIEQNLSNYIHNYDDKNYKMSYVEYAFDYSNTNYVLATNSNNPNPLVIQNIYDSDSNNTCALIYNDTVINTKNKKLYEVVNYIKEAGTYYLVINFKQANITLYDDTYAIIKIVINPMEVEIANPHDDQDVTLNYSSIDSFSVLSEGLNMMSGSLVDYINGFDSTNMYSYSKLFDSGLVYVDALKNVDALTKEVIKQNWKVIIKKTNGTLVTSSDLLSTIFDFNNAAALKKNSSEDYTGAATYYVFIDLGNNCVTNGKNKVVYKIDIQTVNLSLTDFVTISNNTNELESALTRTYTNTTNIKQTNLFDTDVNVKNMDTVLGASDYAGSTIYQYQTNFDNSIYSFDFFEGVDANILNSLNMSIIYSTQKLKNGATQPSGNPLNYVNNSSISANELTNRISSIYTSNNQYTSVGVYYLLITINDDNVRVNNDKKFGLFIHIRADYSNKNIFEYEYNQQTYNLSSETLPTPTLEFVMNKASYKITDTALPTALESIGVVSTSAINVTPENSTNAYTSEKTYTFTDVRFVFDEDRFGGLVINRSSMSVNLVPRRIELNLDNVFTSDFTTITKDLNGNTLKYHDYTETQILSIADTSIRPTIKAKLVAYNTNQLGGYLTDTIIDNLISQTFSIVKATASENFYETGTHNFVPVFTQDASQATFKYVNLICSINNSSIEVRDVINPTITYFNGNHKVLAGVNYNGVVFLKGSVAVSKISLNISNVPFSWANDFRSGTFTNKKDVVNECYMFCGALKDDTHPNKFLESIPSWENKDALIEACVVVTNSFSNFYYHGIVLTGEYLKHYQLNILTWSYTGTGNDRAYYVSREEITSETSYTVEEQFTRR